MARPLFYELSPEKRDRILEAALDEFAAHGYRESSTNVIVKEAGIAKGSLFKYFDSKEALYFDVLDRAVQELTALFGVLLDHLPNGLLERITAYAELEFDFHTRHPMEYALFQRAFYNDGSEIYHTTMQRFAFGSEDLFNRLLQEADMEGVRQDAHGVLDVVRWVLKGYNEDFGRSLNAGEPPEEAKARYMKGLNAALGILREGVY